MNIQEMHSAFRTIGQQMGLQLVRGILPESIDVYLNNVIQEKVQQELLLNVRTAIQDTVDTQSSTMGGINILRSLYKSYRYPIGWKYFSEEFKDNPYEKHNEEIIGDDFEGNALGYILYYNPSNSYTEILLPVKGVKPGSHPDKVFNGGYNPENWNKIEPMMFLGFSVEYKNTKRGNSIPCRLIGADVLDTTLRDYCNGASKESPIVTLLSDEDNRNYIQLYLNEKEAITPYITIKYIKQPNVVKYDVDINNCINCDLPEYCHYEIVERAVLKYQMSIGGGATTRDAKQ